MGTIKESFQLFGKVQLLIDLLKIFAMGYAIEAAVAFNIFPEIRSGPLALVVSID